MRPVCAGCLNQDVINGSRSLIIVFVTFLQPESRFYVLRQFTPYPGWIDANSFFCVLSPVNLYLIQQLCYVLYMDA